ncbi:MAG: hypothetical protein AAB530_02555 [Patescibacteria group bacterium]
MVELSNGTGNEIWERLQRYFNEKEGLKEEKIPEKVDSSKDMTEKEALEYLRKKQDERNERKEK